MKKYLALVLGMLFVLGFTASAFAIHAEIPSETQSIVAKGSTQVTMGGEMRIRGWYLKNASGNRRLLSVPSDSNSQAWYDQRVRLSLAIEASKNTSGFIHLESDTENWQWGSVNNRPGTCTNTDGLGCDSTNGPSDLKFLEAWILYKGTGLGFPAGLKLGHMPLALGEKQFLDHTHSGDDAIVFFMDPTKQLHIGLLTTKFTEASLAARTSGNSNDINGYVALATYKVGTNTFGVNYTYVDDQTGATLANLQNIGLHANGKAGIVSYKAEIDKQFGDAPDGTDADPYPDRYKGLGYMVGVGVTPAPIVTIRAEYAYGSGDNVGTDTDNEAFQTTLGNDIHYTQIFEYTTADPGSGLSASPGRSHGISNVTYYRAGIDINPTKDLSASLDYFILKANETYGAGNTAIGERAPNSKKIGQETDLKISYKLDKNLTYFVMAGYLDTQGWWSTNGQLTTTTDGYPAVANDKHITQVVHGLTLSF